jgi:hypothetical protein
MKDFKSGFNPFSDENISMFLYTFLVLGALLIITILVDKYLIPILNPDNRFVKWWKKHIVDINPFEEK